MERPDANARRRERDDVNTPRGLFFVSRDSVPFVENTSARASSHRHLKTRSRAREHVVPSLLDDGEHGGRRDRRLAGQRFGRGGRGAGRGSRARLVLVDDRCCCGRRHRALGGDDVRARGPRADDRRAVLSRPRGASREAGVPPRVEPRPTAAVVAAEVTDANPAEAPPPLDDADHERAIPPPEPPAPSPVSTRVESESAPVDEMHTLSLSPGASPVALDVASARFDAPAVRLDATRFDLDSALEREEPEPEGPDAPPSSSPSTAPSPPLVASTAHAPPPVVSAMTAELTPPRADAIRSDAVSDPRLDLADSSAPAGLGALGGWALGGFGAATRLARDSLRAVASSDLADKTARAANGVRREIVNLSKHVAGDDLAAASSNPAGDEIATDVPEVNASRDSLWRAFGNLARESARALESAVESAATRPEASARRARRLGVRATRRRGCVSSPVRGAGDDSAAEDAAALERALVECGCASTLDELERLDADASRGSSPTRFRLAVSSPSRFSSWNAC